MENDILEKILQKVNEMDNRFDKVDERLGKMDNRLDKMDDRLNDLEKGQKNIKEVIVNLDENMNKEFIKLHEKFDKVESREYTNSRQIAENHLDISNLERKIE